MELTAAFQFLLSRLDYVSLPGLGSFVRKYEPAKLSPDGKTISAPQEFYTFDSSRNFNDEALENYIHEATGINTLNAASQVTNFVNDITIKLTNGEPIHFEGIGNLQLQPNGSILLICDAAGYSSQTFGLPSIDVTPRIAPTQPQPVQAQNPPKKEVSHTVTTKPIPTGHKGSDSSQIALIVSLCAALAVVAFILISPRAQFWNKSKVAEVTKTKPQPIAQTEPDSTSPKIANDTTPEVAPENQQTTQVDGQKIEISTDKKTALLYTESTPDKRSHYIIVGSFSKKDNATKLINELTHKGYKPNLLEDKNSFRVALYKFSNRDRAMRELERLKAQHISETVWLYSI